MFKNTLYKIIAATISLSSSLASAQIVAGIACSFGYCPEKAAPGFIYKSIKGSPMSKGVTQYFAAESSPPYDKMKDDFKMVVGRELQWYKTGWGQVNIGVLKVLQLGKSMEDENKCFKYSVQLVAANQSDKSILEQADYVGAACVNTKTFTGASYLYIETDPTTIHWIN